VVLGNLSEGQFKHEFGMIIYKLEKIALGMEGEATPFAKGLTSCGVGS
jgi:hypothetical protein